MAPIVRKVSDVTIIGGGVSGLSLAAALMSNPITRSLRVNLIDAKGVVKKNLPIHGYSNRVVSLTPTSQEFLKRINAWQHIDHSRVFPFKQMKVWDAVGNGSLSLNATDRDQIASIIEIDNIINSLLGNNHSIWKGKTSIVLDAETNLPLVRLEDGQEFLSHLVVGADGKDSVVRKYAGIESVGWDYQQKGIVATLQLSVENNFTAWQRFLPSGPVAMLPLGQSMSSLVWSLPSKWASKLMNVDHDLFRNIVNSAFRNPVEDIEYVFSQLNESGPPSINAESIISELEWGRSRNINKSGAYCPPEIINVLENTRASFPLGLSNSTAYAAPRVALIGDAAHRIHPLAGQGLNMGLSDVDALTEVLTKAVYDGSDIGTEGVLKAYSQKRYSASVGMLASVDAIGRIFGTKSSIVSTTRSFGMNVLDSMPLAKQILMNIAG